jgi:hypothetical protein
VPRFSLRLPPPATQFTGPYSNTPGPVGARVLAQHAADFGHTAGAHRFLRCRIHSMELLVARDDLVQRSDLDSSSQPLSREHFETCSLVWRHD